MAKQSTPQNVVSKDEVTVITDIKGETVIEIGSKQYTVRDSQGALTHRLVNQSIQTVDGMQWNPAMQLTKPPVYVGICQQCRDGTSLLKRHKSHGIVTLSRAKMCVVCGTLSCPSHRKLGRDRRWRCLKHHRLHLLDRMLLRPIFFERED